MKTPKAMTLALAVLGALAVLAALWHVLGDTLQAHSSPLPESLRALPSLPLHPGPEAARQALAQSAALESGDRVAQVEESSPVERALPALPPVSSVPAHDGPQMVDTFDSGQLRYEGWRVRDGQGQWVRHGPWTAWHENGIKSEEGAYALGQEDGRWTWWHENGRIMAAGEFDAGERLGPWTFWYANGQKQLQGTYLDGEPSGRWDTWHENGVKWVEGSHLAGEIHGHWTVWNEEGLLDAERTGLYRHGERVPD